MFRLILISSLLLTVTFTCYSQTNNVNRDAIHAFDFWLGEWTVYKYGTDTITGHSRITSIIDSVGIQEFYKTPNGQYHGTSLNKYNANSGMWEQFWVDNSGLTLAITGNLVGGKMVMMDRNSSVGKPLNRISWTPEAKGTVRQTWDQSNDGGATWKTVFDGQYIRKD